MSKASSEPEVLRQEQEMVSQQKFYRCMWMFSATFEPKVEAMTKKYLKYPSQISVGAEGATKKNITQEVILLSEGQKRQKLVDMLVKYPEPPIIIFVNKKADVEDL